MATSTWGAIYDTDPVGASSNDKTVTADLSGGGTVTVTSADDPLHLGSVMTVTYGTTTLTMVYEGGSASGGFTVHLQSSPTQTFFISNNTTIAINTNLGAPDPAINTVNCFLAGTLIATPQGEKAIETLRAGDLVLTADGRSIPVRFVSRQTIVPMFHDGPRARPVRISKGALGDNLPVRDLLVSPGHAIFVDGLLVRAGALVNGSSITQAAAMPEPFVYYNVECDQHELIVAEGLACESFLDEAPRRSFDNYSDYVALYGEAEREMVALDYPLATAARQLPDALAARLGLSRKAA